MAFDTTTYSTPTPTPTPTAGTIPLVVALCPVWTAENPDKALAFLFVAPQDCAAVDVLMAL